jgi:hypothetical protein
LHDLPESDPKLTTRPYNAQFPQFSTNKETTYNRCLVQLLNVLEGIPAQVPQNDLQGSRRTGLPVAPGDEPAINWQNIQIAVIIANKIKD